MKCVGELCTHVFNVSVHWHSQSSFQEWFLSSFTALKPRLPMLLELSTICKHFWNPGTTSTSGVRHCCQPNAANVKPAALNTTLY